MPYTVQDTASPSETITAHTLGSTVAVLSREGGLVSRVLPLSHMPSVVYFASVLLVYILHKVSEKPHCVHITCFTSHCVSPPFACALYSKPILRNVGELSPAVAMATPKAPHLVSIYLSLFLSLPLPSFVSAAINKMETSCFQQIRPHQADGAEKG